MTLRCQVAVDDLPPDVGESGMTSPDLPEFLLARLGEDKWLLDALVDDDPDDPATFSPSRLVAECDAKRRIVEEHGPDRIDVPWAQYHDICRTCRHDGGLDWYSHGTCPSLRLLALPYADHPDYDEAWRP